MAVGPAPLEPAPQAMSLRVNGFAHDQCGRPVQDALVKVSYGSDTIAEAQTDVSGEFGLTTTVQEVGEYGIVATKDGFSSEQQAIAVTSDQDRKSMVQMILRFFTFPSLSDPKFNRAPYVEDPVQYSQRVVFYGTDRAYTDQRQGPEYAYGSERDPLGMNYGWCKVAVPRPKKIGERLKGTCMLECHRADFTGFISELGKSQAASGKAALAMVHGYANTFSEAICRAGQMGEDLEFPGPVIVYSWPSKGTTSGYAADTATVSDSRHQLKGFLDNVISSTAVTELNLIAHSMGCRPTLSASESLVNKYKRVFKHLVLAAPDVDRGDFLKTVPTILSAPEKMTTYVSERDRALALSRHLYSYPRAGETINGNTVVVKDMDTIDATPVTEKGIGHAYLFTSRPLITDLNSLLIQGKHAPRFGMEQVVAAGGAFWRMRA